ncbi:hypothetical protein DPMN_121007 [Dreissena polymorpha]|uniref:Uncharacterized protein n=1 Tax=Dreissena polymorpha TaxID=45954 RepID=A0A9D4JSQ1_DREPO|nr:hypothetical protein DPMN_121007 [Dreissena polymorpha]
MSRLTIRSKRSLEVALRVSSLRMRRNAFGMSATPLRSATTVPPSFLLITISRNHASPPERIIMPILGCQTGIRLGPSIAKVDLRGNLPHGNHTEQVMAFLVVTSKMCSVVNPRSSANIAATSPTSAAAGAPKISDGVY